MNFKTIATMQHKKIQQDSAELRFLEAICAGNAEQAKALFEECQLFGAPVIVDAPQGRYAGKKAIGEFAAKWLDDFHASGAEMETVTQTQAGGRSASEVLIHFHTESERLSVPMCVVGDLRAKGKLDSVRIYFYYGWMKGLSAYRRIIFEPEYQEPAPFRLMTGCMTEYFRLLHKTGDIPERIEEIIAITSPLVTYGGYRPEWVEPACRGHEGIREHYTGICTDAPRNYCVRAETITDDGLQCVVEWTLVVSDSGYAAGRVSQSGVAVYERDMETGLLCSIRICDNVGMEEDILLEELPEDIRKKVAAHRKGILQL